MAENLSDYELRPSNELPPPQRPNIAKLWIVAAVLLAAAGIALYFFNTTRRAPDAATSAPKPAGTGANPRAALGGDPMAVTLPPLEQRLDRAKLVSALSSNPTWPLARADGLVRTSPFRLEQLKTSARGACRTSPPLPFPVLERTGNDDLSPPLRGYTPLAWPWPRSMRKAGARRMRRSSSHDRRTAPRIATRRSTRRSRGHRQTARDTDVLEPVRVFPK